MDVLVYAPAGVLLTAASDLPAMAAKGRQRIEQELRNAQVVGRFVVDAGVRQVGRLAAERDQRDVPARPAARRPAAAGGAERKGGKGAAAHASASTAAPAPPPPRSAAVDRAIPDYDTLSASQVVRRLDGLTPPELRAVVRHERAHRSRRTVLHRAAQLLGDSPAAPPAAPTSS